MLIEPTSLPVQGYIVRIDATGTSAETDLSDSAHFGTLTNNGGSFLIVSDAAVWIKTAFATGTAVSDSATTGATRGFLLPANTPLEFVFRQGPPGTGVNKFIACKSVTGTAHVAIAYVGKMRG